MKRSTIVTLVAIAGFVALLAWSMLSAQKVECEACITFRGNRNCATASADSKEEAVRSAVSTACGPLAGGMDDRLACGAVAPEVRYCRTRR